MSNFLFSNLILLVHWLKLLRRKFLVRELSCEVSGPHIKTVAYLTLQGLWAYQVADMFIIKFCELIFSILTIIVAIHWFVVWFTAQNWKRVKVYAANISAVVITSLHNFWDVTVRHTAIPHGDGPLVSKPKKNYQVIHSLLW